MPRKHRPEERRLWRAAHRPLHRMMASVGDCHAARRRRAVKRALIEAMQAAQ